MIANMKIVPRMIGLCFLFVLFNCGGGGGGGVDATNGSTPVAEVSVATVINTNGATLNGTVIPNGLSTQVWFEYGPDPSLASSSPTSPQSIGEGLTIVPVSVQIVGLMENTKYYFRVCALNSKGETKSPSKSFSTSSSGSPPVATTATATAVGANTATLNGNVTPNGLATDAWFEWGTASTLGTSTSTSIQSVGSGTAGQPVTAGLTGLSTGTTYYYRVAAANGSGTIRGGIVSFIPGAAPAVTTSAATSVGANIATLNGNVTPNGLATDAWFEWGTDSTLGTSTSTSIQSVGSGTAGQPVTAGLTGLSTGTTYYYRVAAANGSGTTRGGIVSFTSNAAPAVTTLVASSVGVGSVTLNGNVTPNGLATDAWFEWGTNSALSTFNSTTSQAVGSGTASQPVEFWLTGLAGGTTYYYRIAATNANGTQKGAIVSFSTTLGTSVPISTSLPATLVTTGAICNGKVNPNGLASTAWFEWSTDPAMATFNTSTSQSIGSGTTNKYMNEPLTGLNSGTTYYYRVVGNNSMGTSRGTIQSFTAGAGTWGFFDDFSTDTTGTYTVYKTLGTESFTYDSTGKKAVVSTGNEGSLIFSHSLTGGSTGAFSMSFSPTNEYGSGGNIRIRLLDTSATYYELSTSDGRIVKYRKGVAVDSVAFPYAYSQGGNYSIKITYDQMVTTVEAFGGRASLTLNTSANPVNYFEIWSTQQDAKYDNIELALP